MMVECAQKMDDDYPTRIVILSDRREPKDPSSYPLPKNPPSHALPERHRPFTFNRSLSTFDCRLSTFLL